MLNIVVCVKAVPDPKAADRLKIDALTRAVPRLDIPLVINSLDAHALELALQLKRKYTAHITAISMGPPPAGNILRECLALGADQGILLCDPAFAGSDAFATAFTLSRAITRLDGVDLVLCGMASSDSATEWVGPEMAAMLDLPAVTRVSEVLKDDGEEWVVKAEHELGYRLVRVRLPAVLTVTRALNTPTALSFSGILKARSKPIVEWNHATLALPAEAVGSAGSPTRVSDLAAHESHRQAQMLEGSLQEKVDQLLQVLEKAGVF